jgi:hypothetical protein
MGANETRTSPLDNVVGVLRWSRGGLKRLRRGLTRKRISTTNGTPGFQRAARVGLPFDPDELESRLVWIFGSPRTGSTWLLKQLCHPLRPDDTQSAGFAAINRPGATRFDALPVNEFRVSSHIAPELGDPVEVDGRLLPATLNNYLADKPAYVFARDYEEVWRPAVRRLVLVRLFAVQAMATRAGARLADSPIMFIKEVNGSHVADLMMSMFPRSRLLFLIRDGRDVVDSRMHAVREGGWLARQVQAQFDGDEERAQWAERAMREWACAVDATASAYRSHPRRRRRMVRYEDLIGDTEGCLGSLFDWLGLPREPERVKRLVAAHSFSALPADSRGPLSRQRAASPGLWRENLTDAEKASATEIMGSRLVELGYEL